MKKKLGLPPELEKSLSTVGGLLDRGKSVNSALPDALAGLAQLPPADVAHFSRLILKASGLRWAPPAARSPIGMLFSQRFTPEEQLKRLPDLSYVLLFHSDGRIREAALRRMSGPLPNAFVFASVVLRLNDWAFPVRAAAVACARRCFPITPPAVVAEALLCLVVPTSSWQRWSAAEHTALNEAHFRPDVTERLVQAILDARTGPMARALTFLLRTDHIDGYLEQLATSARQPSVRAVAVRIIADRTVTWPVGTEWRWIDKSMGHRHRVLTFASRDIDISLPSDVVVESATSDRSAIVRNAALAALIRHRLGSDAAREMAAGLQGDASAAVRERAAFILRHSSDPDRPV